MTSPSRMVSFRFVCVRMFSGCCLMRCQHPAPASPLPNFPFPPDFVIFILLISAREKEKPFGKQPMGFWGSCTESSLTKSSRQAFSLEACFFFKSITNTLEPQNAFAAWFISWIITSFKKRDGISLARLSTLALSIPRAKQNCTKERSRHTWVSTRIQ